MEKRLMIVIFVATQFLAATAMADCAYKGRSHKTNETNSGGGVCQADGSWQCVSPHDGTPHPPGKRVGAAICQPDGTWR